jgi:transposase
MRKSAGYDRDLTKASSSALS